MENNEKTENYAFIDGANLYRGNISLGWKLDYGRFRSWLRQKFGITRAYIFIGFMPRNAALYTYLRGVGFELIFKEVVFGEGGQPKGNCDAELVLQSVCDYFEGRFKTSVLVASDGDYACLVRFLRARKSLSAVLSPATSKKCSYLLRKTAVPIVYLNQVKDKIDVKLSKSKRAPDTDVSV